MDLTRIDSEICLSYHHEIIIPISTLAYIRPLVYVKCFCRLHGVDPVPTC